MNQHHNEISYFLKNIAFEAGEIMKYYYNKEYNIYEKTDKTKVTEVDLKISELVQKKLKNKYPEMDLISEESNQKTLVQNKNTFIIDELDGTNNYIHQNGDFAHCSAYYDKTEGFVIGLVYFPLKNTMISAIKHHGAYLTVNQKAEEISKLPFKAFNDLKFSHPLNYKGNKYHLCYEKMDIAKERVIRSGGSDLLDILSGKYEASILLHKQIPIWDILPSKIILEELDYSYSYLNGNQIDFFKNEPENKGYLICPKSNIAEIIKILKGTGVA